MLHRIKRLAPSQSACGEVLDGCAKRIQKLCPVPQRRPMSKTSNHPWVPTSMCSRRHCGHGSKTIRMLDCHKHTAVRFFCAPEHCRSPGDMPTRDHGGSAHPHHRHVRRIDGRTWNTRLPCSRPDAMVAEVATSLASIPTPLPTFSPLVPTVSRVYTSSTVASLARGGPPSPPDADRACVLAASKTAVVSSTLIGSTSRARRT